MNNYECSNNVKTKHDPRLESTTFHDPGNQRNFFGRPPFPRRRMMSRRYTNIGFRPSFPPALYRPDCPPPPVDFRCRPNAPDPACPPAVPPPVIQRPPFSCGPPIFNRKNNQFYQIPRNNVNGGRISAEPDEQKKQPNESSAFSDLWIEALAPKGKVYYYNFRTRETTWNKPTNTRVIGFNGNKHSPRCSSIENEDNLNNESQNQSNNPYVQRQPNNQYVNAFLQVDLSKPPPKLMTFPPPQNVCNPPHIFIRPPVENIQTVATFRFNAAVSHPLFSYPVVAESFLPGNEVSYQNQAENSDTVTNNSGATDVPFVGNEEYNQSSGEKKIFKNSTSENNILYCESNSTDITKDSDREEKGTLKDIEMTVDMKYEPAKSAMADAVCMLTEKSTYSKSREQKIDKSRPVSSTPVPGTNWFVVWTGDEKVFFYDSERKVSIWERPAVLGNRSDVDKLVQKSPLSIGLKPTKKEVRNTSFNRWDVTKKLKKRDELKDESHSESSSENAEKTVVQKSLKPEQNPGSTDISHDQRVKIFREMLSECRVSAFSTWEQEVHKFVMDSRYTLLTKDDRQFVFEDYAKKMGKRDRHMDLLSVKERFLSLLQEAGVTSKSKFADVANRFAKDNRFRAVEQLRQREDFFNQYISNLIKKERVSEMVKSEQKKKFIELLREKNCVNKAWREVQKTLANDKRYNAIQSESEKQNIFDEYKRGECLGVSQNEREMRTNTSLRNRKDLSVPLEKQETQPEIPKFTPAIVTFKAILNDFIKDADIKWSLAELVLKKDHRWNSVQCLESEKKEELFYEHVDTLIKKKKVQFHRLLDETPNMTFKTSWSDIRKTVLKDPRCSKFSTNERKCEKEFKEYTRKRLSSAKAEFKELLKETKLITSETKSLLSNKNHLQNIENVLGKDKRYLNLDCRPSERREILLTYIEKLHSNDYSPSTTASDLSNRIKYAK